MKLRQKLAVVLASAMIITAVPVTTMAASTNKLNKTVSLVEGTQVTTKSGLNLEMKFDQTSVGQVFFVDATDFEFVANEYKMAAQGTMGALETAIVNAQNTVNAKQAELDALKAATTPNEAAIAAKEVELTAAKKTLADKKEDLDNASASNLTIGDVKVSVLSKSQLKVEVIDESGTFEVKVPVYGKAKKGNPAITVDGSDSLATSGKYTLTGAEIVTDKVLAATVGDVKNISVDGAGVIADITIEEQVAKSINGKVITITLPNSSDLIFSKEYATEKTLSSDDFEGKRGLADNIASVKAKYAVDKDGNKDNKKLEVVVTTKPLPTGTTATKGSVVLKNIAVQAEDKKGDCSTGEVKVTVASKDAMADTKLVVANVADYGVALTVDAVDDLTAGQGTTKVKVKIKENAIDSLNKKQNVFFTIEEGRFVSLTSKDGFSLDLKEQEITLDLLAKNAKDEAIFSDNKINEFEFEVEIAAKATHEGPVVIKAESRAFDEDLTVEVAKVTPAVEIKSEPITVKAGLKDQVGGKIVITETKEEKLAKNKEIRINCAEKNYGFDVKDAKIEVTGGDIQIESEVKDGEIIIKVKRPSDEASTITITNMEVTTDRTVPEGTFDFQVGGTAISDLNNEKYTDKDGKTAYRSQYEDAIKVEDFIKVGTKNTEDLPNAAVSKEIVLTAGSMAYTVNGEAKTADAAVTIKDGRTMVPVRLVADEFGKVDFGTINGVGTVTVFKDGNVLQFQNGSNIMNKNGIAIPMDAKCEIVNGRTFIPVKYVADGLGISYTWDAATKSVTFTNKAK